jgi:hypothetical protein
VALREATTRLQAALPERTAGMAVVASAGTGSDGPYKAL